MSQDNIQIVLGVFDAFRRGDAAATFAAYDPDVEWNRSTTRSSTPEQQRGLEG